MIKWSHSRDSDVRTCERRAFLKYRYASATARRDWRRFYAHILKRAVDPTTWAGNITHHVISTVIIPAAQQHGGDINVDEAICAACKLVEKQYEFSKEHRFETCSRTEAGDSYCVLRAHLSGTGEPDQAKQAALDLCSKALRNLVSYHSDILTLVGTAARVDAEKEIRIRVDADLMVEAILDLLLLSRSGRGAIIDWKLWGQGGFAGDQLMLYAYAVVNSGWWPNLTLDKISVVEANLLTGKKHIIHPTLEDMAMVDDRIFTGAERLERIFEKTDLSEIDQRLFTPASRPGACMKCQVSEVCYDAKFRLQQPTNLAFEFLSY